MAHTPGPWTHRPSPVDRKPYRCVYFSTKRDEPYATSALEPDDARLIAAAPDLLAACKAMAEAFLYHNPGGTTKPQSATLIAAREAIAKAESP